MEFTLQQHQICEAATALFLARGYDHVSLKEIAEQAGLAENEAYKYFGSKEDVMLYLYQRINTDWEIFVSELEDANLSARFERAMLKKIELIAPYAGMLSEMMNLLLRNATLGVNAPRTRHLRLKGLRILGNLAAGAKPKFLKDRVKNLPALLYLLHWAILFLHVQSGDEEKTRSLVNHIARLLKRGDHLLSALPLLPLIQDLSALFALIVSEEPQDAKPIAKAILEVIFNHRKISSGEENCAGSGCEKCLENHVARVDYFVSLDQPIHFVLPAFPAKSPNQTKVLGELPDLGEETALITLETMCMEIADAYPPGARVTICSDGRIFADLVGVTDDQVTRYVTCLKKMIVELGLKHVEVVNLEDLLPDRSFDEARRLVIANYAESLEELREKVSHVAEFKQLFNGIHRFISEDRMATEPQKSKTRIKEESKPIALQVIQHSKAWTRFLARDFPESIRLSIHPYSPHADKIGIRLTRATDNWLTPWHGVMVLTADGYLLMKKQEAETLNAQLVRKDNRNYFYRLVSKNE
jgi:pyoverdine/dityrosine biosynthesis protein Dit1